MLTIRESQMEVFRDARRRTFEDSLFSQIARKFPAELDHLSESGLRSLMNLGVAPGGEAGRQTPAANYKANLLREEGRRRGSARL